MKSMIEALKERFGNPDLKKSPLGKLGGKEEETELEKQRRKFFEERRAANPKYYDENYESDVNKAKRK